MTDSSSLCTVRLLMPVFSAKCFMDIGSFSSSRARKICFILGVIFTLSTSVSKLQIYKIIPIGYAKTVILTAIQPISITDFLYAFNMPSAYQNILR